MLQGVAEYLSEIRGFYGIVLNNQVILSPKRKSPTDLSEPATFVFFCHAVNH